MAQFKCQMQNKSSPQTLFVDLQILVKMLHQCIENCDITLPTKLSLVNTYDLLHCHEWNCSIETLSVLQIHLLVTPTHRAEGHKLQHNQLKDDTSNVRLPLRHSHAHRTRTLL